MFSTKSAKIIIALTVTSLCMPALAHDYGFYAGVEAGYSFVEKIQKGATSQIAGRAYGGYQFSPYLAAEFGILGNLHKLYLMDGSVKATLPFTNETYLFIRGGIADIRDSSFNSLFTTVTYGAGAGFGVTGPFSVDVSYQGYGTDKRVDFVSLGFSYHFN